MQTPRKRERERIQTAPMVEQEPGFNPQALRNDVQCALICLLQAIQVLDWTRDL